jgi:hypothetical protein
LQDIIDQKSKEILYDCQIRSEGDSAKAAQLLAQQLSDIFPYMPEPAVNAKRFEQIVKNFKLSI